MNYLLKQLHPGVQFLLFLSLVLTCMGVGSVTAGAIGILCFHIPLEELPAIFADPGAEHAVALIWINNISQIFTFLFPVAIFYALFGGKTIHGLLLKRLNWLVILAPLVVLCSNGLIDLSSLLNKALIPDNSSLAQAIKPAEDLAEKLTKLFLDSSLSPFLILLSVAIIPAVCEELCFRGVLMPVLAKMTKNIHAAVWITAALFSIIHFQFYGFLPRMILGALLGYLVVWSGSIWSSIFAHFVNNALAIVLYRQYGSLETPADAEMTQWYSYAISIGLFLLLLMVYYRNSKWPWLSFEYLGIAGKGNPGENTSQQLPA